MLREELIVEIGQVLTRNATASAAEWNFVGWMFETRDGQSSGGTKFIYNGRDRIVLKMDYDDEVTRVEGDAYWIKCLAVLRRDGDMRLLFEFDDWTRWSISPANVDRAYEILVGEIYPEALGPVQGL